MNLADSGSSQMHVQQNLIWNLKDESQDVLLIECSLRNNCHVWLLSSKRAQLQALKAIHTCGLAAIRSLWPSGLGCAAVVSS